MAPTNTTSQDQNVLKMFFENDQQQLLMLKDPKYK